MPAAYQNLTATSSVDLLQKIVSFLTGQGWATNLSQADGNSGWRAHLSKNGAFVNFRASTVDNLDGYTSNTNPCLAVYMSTGYDGSKAWNMQPGGATGGGFPAAHYAGAPLIAAAFQSVWMLDDGADNICIVIEPSQNVYTVLGFGVSVNKIGAWTGGAYYFAQASWMKANQASAVNSPVPFAGVNGSGSVDSEGFVFFSGLDGKTGWAGNGLNDPLIASVAMGMTSDGSIPPYAIASYTGFAERQFNGIDGVANLLPIRLYVSRNTRPATAGGAYSMAAEVPSLFVCNAMAHGASPGSTLQIGADTYLLFPNFAVKKNA